MFTAERQVFQIMFCFDILCINFQVKKKRCKSRDKQVENKMYLSKIGLDHFSCHHLEVPSMPLPLLFVHMQRKCAIEEPARVHNGGKSQKIVQFSLLVESKIVFFKRLLFSLVQKNS